MAEPASSVDCLICSMEHAPPAARVFQDEHWAAEVVPGYDVPGWFVLRARRHAELLTGLYVGELASFGTRARDLTDAVQQATGAPAVYLMAFGENYRHFHALIAARGAEVPPERRAGAILQLRADGLDREAALRLVPEVADAYRRISSGRAAAPA